MRIFGLTITRKALNAVASAARGWVAVVREGFSGAWQRNVEVNTNLVLSYHAVFGCMTLIASDIAKLRPRVVKQLDTDSPVWVEKSNPAYSPVLRKPNAFQTRYQFWENWILSKLSRGNTYVLKRRDARNVVIGMYILDPSRVLPLVSDDGQVFYQLNVDNMVGLEQGITVPAREIIHDRFNCLFHPLVGISPIYACGLAATQGLAIQNNTTRLFQNGARPGGILTAPGKIGDDTAKRLKEHWENNYTGENAGKLAVLGDGLKYESLSISPEDAQVIEQLKWTSETCCSTFHVPPYKLGLGTMPTNNNVQALNLEYYTQCLQSLIEAAELCLDDGLGIGEALGIGTEFDTDGLLRMDTLTLMDTLDKGKNVMTPDEARAKVNLGPTPGGNVVYRQQQDFSLAALAKRDAQDDPFARASASIPAAAVEDGPTGDPAANDNNAEVQANRALVAMMKGLG